MLCDSTSNGADQYQNSSSNLLTPYREQPRSTRIVAAYPRPAFSATNRTNYAPTSFDQRIQVSQGHTPYKNKENRNTEVHGGGGLDLVRPGREPASSRPKPCASLKNSHKSCPFAAPFAKRKMTVVRHQLFPQKPPGSRLRFSRTGVSPPLARRRSSFPPPSAKLVRTRLSATVLLASRVPPPSRRAPTGARKRRTPRNAILSQPYRSRVSADRLKREGSQLAASLEREPGPTPAGKTLPHSYPETRFWRERARGTVCMYVCCMVIKYSKTMDQPGKFANPARGQLNRENLYFPVPVRA